MSLLFPWVLGLLGTRFGARWADRVGLVRARPWSSWPASSGVAMAAVLVAAGTTHFTEPQRSGLVAIVPDWVPLPQHVVTASGALELLLAAGLLHPRSRRPSALVTIALLVAMFPANVVAARGVDHPDAPSTALLPRTALQALLVGTCLVAARRPGRPSQMRAGSTNVAPS